MTAPALDVDDVVILLLGAPADSPRLKDRINGITRLEKMFFLWENESEFPVPVNADFTAHNFGPFSAKIYQAVDVLAAAQLIQDSATLSPDSDDAWERENLILDPEDIPDRFATRDFSLTERGRRYYQALLKDLPPDAEKRLTEFKERFGKMPLRQLVRYVYEQPRYKDYLKNSIIRDEILGT